MADRAAEMSEGALGRELQGNGLERAKLGLALRVAVVGE